ncbi:MAG: MFS transporter [Hyphomicrobiaceae bacterium]
MIVARWSNVLQPFAIRSFRFQWAGDLATSWAFEMEPLILGWYILVETGSVLYLTVFGSLLFLGTLLSPVFGVVADRIGHRNLLCAMRAAYVILAGALTLAIVMGYLSPEVALGLAFLSGLIRPSDIGVRSALVASLVPPNSLVSAMSISRTTSDSARVVGALAGSSMFAAIGIAPTYVAITFLYLAGLLLTLQVSAASEAADNLVGQLRSSPWQELREGVAYVWKTPHLQAAMWLALLVNLTAFPLSIGLLPYVAKEIYGTEQTGLGYLLASFSIGALLGSIYLSMFGQQVKAARAMLSYSFAWHIFLLFFAYTTDIRYGIPLLVLAGLSQSLSLLPLVVMLMRTSDPAFRGRVMGVRILAIYSLPVGLVISGALIDSLGFRTAMTLYMVTGILVTALIAVGWRKSLLRETAIGNSY